MDGTDQVVFERSRPGMKDSINAVPTLSFGYLCTHQYGKRTDEASCEAREVPALTCYPIESFLVDLQSSAHVLTLLFKL